MPDEVVYIPIRGELAHLIAAKREQETREERMVKLYGETCTRKDAAKILSRSRQCIANMLSDGRLTAACGGSMVDVRSIAAYIEQPQARDAQARYQKRAEKRGDKLSRFRV